MRVLPLLSILAVTAAWAWPAAAQTRPSFWDVSAQAAADAGLDSPEARLLVENAYELAEEHDKAGVRPTLSQVQLMIAAVAADRFDLYQSRFGVDTMHVDVSKFDRAILDYVPTLSDLQRVYYDRWLNPGPDEQDGIRYEVLRYAAEKLAAIKVAILERVAADDDLTLADAKLTLGLSYKVEGRADDALKNYSDAETIYTNELKLRLAMDTADRAFTTNESADLEDSDTTTKSIVDLTLSPDAQYVAGVTASAALPELDKAIKSGNAKVVEKMLDVVETVFADESFINRLMAETWQCHINNAPAHFWRAEITKRKIEVALKGGASDDAVKEMRAQADLEYRRSLEIDLFAKGATPHLNYWAEGYEDFLKKADRADDAGRVEDSVRRLGPADIGTGGPAAWRDALDCERLSR